MFSRPYTYSFASRQFEQLTDMGSAQAGQAVWLNDDRRALFLRQGQVLLVDSQTKQAHEVLSFAPHRLAKIARAITVRSISAWKI